jgi:hypothetical protein
MELNIVRSCETVTIFLIFLGISSEQKSSVLETISVSVGGELCFRQRQSLKHWTSVMN